MGLISKRSGARNFRSRIQLIFRACIAEAVILMLIPLTPPDDSRVVEERTEQAARVGAPPPPDPEGDVPVYDVTPGRNEQTGQHERQVLIDALGALLLVHVAVLVAGERAREVRTGTRDVTAQ